MALLKKIVKAVADSSKLGKSAVSPRGLMGKAIVDAVSRTNRGTKVAPMPPGTLTNAMVGTARRAPMPVSVARGAIAKVAGDAIKRGTMGRPFQKGGTVDKAGRALGKKTADSMGRAMAKAPMKKNMGGMAKKSSKKC